MGLPSMNLDDRRWADLVDEARALIPFYAPSWTDHNLHDPGITLVELLAWIAEMDVYELNRIPARHRRKFLRLAGIRSLPPQPARTVAGLRLADGTSPLPVPIGARLEAVDAFGMPTPFRTITELTAVACEIAAVQVHDGRHHHDVTAAWRRGEPVTLLGDDPDVGAELYLGLTRPLPLKADATFAVVLDDPRGGDDERRRLDAIAARELTPCQAPTELLECDPPPRGPTPTPGILRHHSAHVVWEIAVGGDRWRPLVAPNEIQDRTRAFTLSGHVVVRVPSAMACVAVGETAAHHYYLRCRLAGGRLDAAPRAAALVLNGVWIEQASPPEAASGAHGIGTKLGRGTGAPSQTVVLPGAPVVEESVTLETRDKGSDPWRPWTLHDDFDASGPADLHYVLDPTSGTVTFGDGDRGDVVHDGSEIRARYLTTRGEGGNLPRGLRLSWRADTCSAHTFETVLPATGGAAAEPLADAQGRARELLAGSGRAITADDYRGVARSTPGTRVARAIALPNRHPRHPCVRAPGVVTVVVVPYLPAARPEPSCGLREVVRRHLHDRRLVGTRVEVIGPRYEKLTVQARVTARGGIETATVRQRVVAALDRFFHPLHGGADGGGWPLGRDVYRAEVLEVIDGVDGVDHVASLSLVGADGKPRCGNICIPWNGLVVVGSLGIEVI